MDLKSLGSKDTLKNADGHIIGYRERGEDVDRITLFTPRFGEAGNIVAYEERVKGGVVLWDTKGKRIGHRYADLRSRGTNAYNRGLTIVFRPQQSERLALAQVTIDDIKQYLEQQN